MTDKPTRGNPPVSGRFRKGQSGNLKGRPKSKDDTPKTSAIEVILDKTLTVMRGGAPREISMEEALQQQTLQQALEGNRSAQREVRKWIAKREKYFAAENQRKSPQVVTSRITTDPANADEALLLLEITALDPRRQDIKADRPQMLLEPWSVQAALSRRRGGQKLTEKDVADIRRCTRDPDSLRWPKGIEE
ncbi:DUF5681 domain-containing protein [Sneathiella sp. HT1-7]|uniref:DUF5681 domain-containing protein n=1 Tax=Sneathiella sp. HT1-7 TaxID=2887192 RepID=UPI001D1434C1|nr:DUF5681 domain-containing protein [Sneathiella sp. HT1-7]MCC3306801.1 DUF5681 domain-containing protein [Sneathiella sp. HT1-7]